MNSPQQVSEFCQVSKNKLKPVAKTLKDRLDSTLKTAGVDVEVITYRIKTPESVTQKLQTGQYESISDIDDMAGVMVVVSRLSEVSKAMEVVRDSERFQTLEVESNINSRSTHLRPEELRLHEPKLLLALNNVVASSNSSPQVYCEVQFTTMLQYALNKATHDFAYKSRDENIWSNSRLVAQMRGMLEMIDRIVDDFESAPLPEHNTNIGIYQEYEDISKLIVSTFGRDEVKDLRRASITVVNWCRLARKEVSDLKHALDNYPAVIEKRSLDPVSAIFGVMIKEFGVDWVNKKNSYFLITDELLTFVPEVKEIKLGKRVTVDRTAVM